MPIKPEPGDRVLLVRCSSNDEFNTGDAEVAYVTVNQAFLETLGDRAELLREAQEKDDQLVELHYRGHAEFFSNSHEHDDVEKAEEEGWLFTCMDVAEIDEDHIMRDDFTALVMSCYTPHGDISIYWVGIPKHGSLTITTESIELKDLIARFNS